MKEEKLREMYQEYSELTKKQGKTPMEYLDFKGTYREA